MPWLQAAMALDASGIDLWAVHPERRASILDLVQTKAKPADASPRSLLRGACAISAT